MNLNTAAIIGLSRQPLDEEAQALAAQLMVEAGNPAEEALALLSARSIAHRANLRKAKIQEVQVSESIPEHPDYQIIGNHIFNYLEASLAFRGSTDVLTCYDRGLVVPASKIPWFLEAVIRKQNVRPEAYSLLGRRGLWLSLKHPTFMRKVAFLQADTFPKSVKQREAYVCFWWSELFRAEKEGIIDNELINRFRRLFTAAKLSDRTFGLLQAALKTGFLAKAVKPSLLLNLFSRKRDITNLEYLLLECLMDEERKTQVDRRAKTVLSELPNGCDHRETFEVLAKAAISSHNSSAAATLLDYASSSGDRLIKGQKILTQLASVLDESSYADLMDYAYDRYPKGWRDPMVASFIETNPNPFSNKLSEELASEAIHGYAPPSETVVGRYTHKLSTSILGHLLSLRQAQGGLQDNQSETLNALLAMTLAKQRIESEFPVVK